MAAMKSAWNCLCQHCQHSRANALPVILCRVVLLFPLACRQILLLWNLNSSKLFRTLFHCFGNSPSLPYFALLLYSALVLAVMCATIFGIIFEPIYCNTNCTASICFNKLYAKVQLVAIAIGIVRFNVCQHGIYADVFSIFYHSLQLSCGRNNTKMARANYDICTTVRRYRCFRCYFEYTTYTNICFRIKILRIFRSHLSVKLLHSMFLHTAPTSADVFLIFRYSSIQSSGCFFNMAAMNSVRTLLPDCDLVMVSV